MSSDWQRTVIQLLLADTSDLRNLATIAGADYRTFYRGANFRSADLSGQDLAGLDLSGATRNTKLLLQGINFGNLDAEPESTRRSDVRINITINQAIHEWLKRRNRGFMNAHVERLIVCFIRDHLQSYEVSETFEPQTSKALEEKILVMHSDEIGIVARRRVPVAYSLGYRVRDAIYLLSEALGITNSEAVRISIYWVLLHDLVRGIPDRNN
jgi:hypothetical protein